MIAVSHSHWLARCRQRHVVKTPLLLSHSCLNFTARHLPHILRVCHCPTCHGWETAVRTQVYSQSQKRNPLFGGELLAREMPFLSRSQQTFDGDGIRRRLMQPPKPHPPTNGICQPKLVRTCLHTQPCNCNSQTFETMTKLCDVTHVDAR